MQTNPDMNNIVVAIGASAGGIEALTKLLQATPEDTGFSFIVVIHLDSPQAGFLSPILHQHTSMPVVDIKDGALLAPNVVHLLSPEKDVFLEGPRLRLKEPSQPKGRRHPIDLLFSSVAEQVGERAVAVVLSGMGTNGTSGLRDIRAKGGLVVVQEPSTARFDSMPRSAISAGLVDEILEPAKIPAALISYSEADYIKGNRSSRVGLDSQLAALGATLDALRRYSAEAFRSYKPNMLLRRITRRMALRGIARVSDYAAMLGDDPTEAEMLASDLLINVSGFYRDEEAWQELEALAVELLLASKEPGEPLRVWIPACSTGEEAYSLTMLILDVAERLGRQIDLKVFASDIMESNLAVAREGMYPSATVEALPTEKVQRYFEKEDGTYRVRPHVRDRIVFAKQDLLCDPPFSRMDLITCRIFLIYIEPDAQRKDDGTPSLRPARWGIFVSRIRRNDQPFRRPIRRHIEEVAHISSAI